MQLMLGFVKDHLDGGDPAVPIECLILKVKLLIEKDLIVEESPRLNLFKFAVAGANFKIEFLDSRPGLL